MDWTTFLAEDLRAACGQLRGQADVAGDCCIVLSQARKDSDLFPPAEIDDTYAESKTSVWRIGGYLSNTKIRAIVTNDCKRWETLVKIGAALLRAIAAKPRMAVITHVAHEPWRILEHSLRQTACFHVPWTEFPLTVLPQASFRPMWLHFVAAMVCTANQPAYATAFITETGERLERDKLDEVSVWYSETIEAVEVSLRCVEALLEAIPGGATSPSGVGEGSQGAEEEKTSDGTELSLTQREAGVLNAMATANVGELLPVQAICRNIPAGYPCSERTVREAVRDLIKKKLAERPEGERRGARLTTEGRRFSKKVDV